MVDEAKREVHDILFFASKDFALCSCEGKVEYGMVPWVLLTTSGGNGEIEGLS